MSQFLKEFRDFAIKGSVVDMAIGIIIGAAFGGIVSSLVDDVIMPPIGYVLSEVDFSDKAIVLKQAAPEYDEEGNVKKDKDGKNVMKPAVKISYGKFINSIIKFLIVAFALFLVIKQINRLRNQPPQEPTTKNCPFCQSTISIKATRCPQCTSDLTGGLGQGFPFSRPG
jgi:large conductance mechanosensitive channel